MADTDTDSDGAYVERLAAELGAMLLPADYERLVGMARRAERMRDNRDALREVYDALTRLTADRDRLREALAALALAAEGMLGREPPARAGLAAAVRAARAALGEGGT